MRGDNTLWQVGTDHAGIATQIVVEQQLKAQGKTSRSRARTVRAARLGVERGIRRCDHQPDAAPGRLGRLVARALHDGRGPVGRSPRHVRAASRRRAHLSRQAPRQLGPEARHGGVRSRSRQRGIAGKDLGDSLSAGRWFRRARRRDDATRDDAGRYGSRRESGRRALSRVRRQGSRAAAAGRRIPVVADAYVDRESAPAPSRSRRRTISTTAARAAPWLPALSIFDLEAKVNDNAPEKYRGLDRYVARKAVLADLAPPVSW